MHKLDFWFDPISPYAYLAFEALPQALEGLSVVVDYHPVLFAGLLTHWGQKGPAEIEPKRVWTYRDVAWRAHQQGTTLDLPAQHPFNPLALLRLCLACAPAGGTPNRRVVEAVFRHAWQGGSQADDAQRLKTLREALAPSRDPDSVAVKAELRVNTDKAAAAGIFGVPTIVSSGRSFWGTDAIPLLSEHLRGNPWFDGPAWDAAAAPRGGVTRR
jgi:2-hydroxychromene-2-carboxylate isomerase